MIFIDLGFPTPPLLLNGISMFPICAQSSLAANERQESRARVLITTTWSRRRAGVWFCRPDGAIGKWLLGGAWGC